MTILSKRAAGGHARAKALTPERRSEIAEKAARARWDACNVADDGALCDGDEKGRPHD